MRDLPVVAKLLINVIFYIIYVFFASVAFSILFPLLLQVVGQEIINYNDPIFEKIQYFILFLVLIITIIFRKYFYISLARDAVMTKVGTQGYTSKKKPVTKKKTTKILKGEEENQQEDDIKIYVEKEIK